MNERSRGGYKNAMKGHHQNMQFLTTLMGMHMRREDQKFQKLKKLSIHS